jgi:hypothetical protein
MSLLDRLLGRSKQDATGVGVKLTVSTPAGVVGRAPRERNSAGGLREADVRPVRLVPGWPVLPPRPFWPIITTEERNALPYEATECPACGADVASPPKGHKRCGRCGNVMHVYVTRDRTRRLVTDADLATLQAADAAREQREYEAAGRSWYDGLRSLGLLVAQDGEGITQEVTGESHRIAVLAGLMRTLHEHHHEDVMAAALLVPEPTNRYDLNAIRVSIHDEPVGYIPREDASEVGRWLKRVSRSGRAPYLLARLGGGWAHDGWIGPIGVTLEALPDDFGS